MESTRAASGNCSLLRFKHAPSKRQQRQTPARAVAVSSSDPAATTKLASSTSSSKPVRREIPGSYGLPLLGALQDRLDYFYGDGGSDAFFKKRMKQYGSSVMRVNMPPGPPFFPSSRVVALLDAASFATLFDTDKVSKRDVFTGTYASSLQFTGGYRVLSYLDVDEPKHGPLKAFCSRVFASNAASWIPSLRASCAAWLDGGITSVEDSVERVSWSLLTRSVLDKAWTGGADDVSLDSIKRWILPQIAPVYNAGVPGIIQEPLLHTFPLPYFLVANDHRALVDFFAANARGALAMASKEFKLEHDEALHNLIFCICFNTHGGLIRLLPSVLKHIDFDGGPDLQSQLRSEVRSAVENHGAGEITPAAIAAMPLLESTVYEVLRFDPPVASQYGRARRDMVVESHDEAFRVRAGEMLYGHQPLVTRDPLVFEDPDTFDPRRFMGNAGRQLLRYIFWSNGRETDTPSQSNKQCPGKDFVVLIARAFVADLFLRYDSFRLTSQPKLSFASLVKRS